MIIYMTPQRTCNDTLNILLVTYGLHIKLLTIM